jgi:hypothetical protein
MGVLLNSFEIDSVNPNTLCLCEHSIEEQDLLNLTLADYVLGYSFC